MMFETTFVKEAKRTAVQAVKSTIDYKKLGMRESMVINSYIEATINQLLRRVPVKGLKGMAQG